MANKGKDPPGISIPGIIQNITAQQIKAGRALLGWEQADLARVAGLSVPTVNRMENLGPHRCMLRNLLRVQQAFTAAGVTFIHERQENGELVGVARRLED